MSTPLTGTDPTEVEVLKMWTAVTFPSEVNNRETTAAVEAKNDTYLSFSEIQTELPTLPRYIKISNFISFWNALDLH